MIGRLSGILGSETVIVYTMGKVGSTAVETNLDGAFHTHTLYGFPPSPPYHRLKFGRWRMALRRWTVYPLKRFLLRRRTRIRIITFYRDPKQRNPSMFMQDLPYWLTDYLLGTDARLGLNRAEAPDLLVDAYRAIFPHDYPAQWVARELACFSGIPASRLALGDADHKVIEHENVAIFIGRAERMDACEAPLAAFLGRATIKISATNRGEGKWYAPIYSSFQAQLAGCRDIDYCEEFRRANGYRDV